MGHSHFAPSASERWINCTGSFDLEAEIQSQIGEKPTSTAMSDGTRAHAKLEKLVKEHENFRVGLYESEDITPDEREWFKHYVDALDDDLDMLDAEILVETQLTSKVDPRLGGTADAVVYSLAERTVAVTDYKHGINHYVPADAYQLKIYGHMVLDLLGPDKFDTLIIRIVQPRYRGDAAPVREHVIENASEWHKEFRTLLVNTINAIDKGETTFNYGDHCVFCRGKGLCPATSSTLEEIIDADPDPLYPDFELRLANILNLKAKVNAIIKNAEELAVEALENGRHVPGYTLVEKLGNREWNGKEETIARNLRKAGVDKNEVWVKSLISPTQAEKLVDLDEKFVSKYITREVKGKKLKKQKLPKNTNPKEILTKTELTADEKALIEEF